ncbi:Pfs NACHT and ankyrin domain protein [Penicillium tannophilum]|nr:Pfs NACHT and ankyrin domain protein [Penicillium tannophilum]
MAGNMNFGDRNSSLQVGNNYGTITTANSPEGSDQRTHRDKALASLNFKKIGSRKLDITTSLKETCEWLLGHENYKTWLDDRELPQHHGFFWISGKPGAGKSTIMKFAYLDMKNRCQTNDESGRHDNPVIASFFFNARGEDLEKSVQGLYRSLLLQLLQGFPDLQVVLDNKDLVPPVARDEAIMCPPLNALKDLLHNAIILLGQRTLTFFIDALDECDENDIADMVDHFEDLTEQALSQNCSFRICFSSRHYPHITINYGIRLTLESQVGHSGDLELYVSTRMKIKDADLHQKLKSRLLDKAAGVFLWVVLVVRILNKEYRRAGFNLERRLEELPSDLSSLFKAILLRDTENPEDLLLCILWILYAKRPLRPEEFYHALWSGLAMKQQNLVDEALPELLSSSSDTSDSNVLSSEGLDKVTIYVISSSKGLAEVTRPVQSTKKRTADPQMPWLMPLYSQQNENDSDHERRVQFIHESVRDFLIKDKGLSDLWPDLNLSDEAMAHDVLKQCCRFYMDHELKTRPGGPDSRLGLKSDIGQTQKDPWLGPKASLNKQIDRIPRGYVFLDYATEYVLFHAEGAAKLVLQDDFLSSFPVRYWKKARAFYNGAWDAEILPIGRKDGLFHIFATYGLSELIRTRRRRDIKVHALGGNIKHPLFAALRKGHFDAVAALLNLPSYTYKGVDIIRREDFRSRIRSLLSMGELTTETPLSWAARDGKFEIVELLLLDKTVPVNDDQEGGMPALVGAIRSGHKDIARLLVESGADVNHRYPLTHASRKGHEDMVKLLLEKGADIHHGSPLEGAASRGHEAVLRLLINNGVNLDKDCPLRLASIRGHENVVEILIDSGADIEKGHPLAAACEVGHEAIVKLLLSRGADANAQDEAGVTPLMNASAQNHGAIVKLLIGYGADINHKDNLGATPRQMMSLNTATKAIDVPWSRERKKIFQ